MSKLNTGLFTSDNDSWETPQALFDELNKKYHFDLDPCSSDTNAKCINHYTIENSGLSHSWQGYKVFMNPPYGSQIKDWVRKAYLESFDNKCLVVGLLPARTDTQWFHNYIYHKAQVIFLKGRLKFELDKKQLSSAPFPSMLVIWGEML